MAGLTLKNKKSIIQQAQGHSTRNIEKMLAQIDESCVSSKKQEKIRFVKNNKIELKVTLDESCYQKLEELKYLLSHKNPSMSYRKLIEILADLGLKKYKLKRQQEYRNHNHKKQEWKNQDHKKQDCKRQKINKNIKQTTKQKSVSNKNNSRKEEGLNQFTSFQNNTNKLYFDTEINDHITSCQNNINKKAITRYIPQKVRQYVWKRDKGRCSYTCPQTKTLCQSQYQLQVDHIQPYSLDGSHHPKNLRLLCLKHNQYRSDKTFNYSKRRLLRHPERRYLE